MSFRRSCLACGIVLVLAACGHAQEKNYPSSRLPVYGSSDSLRGIEEQARIAAGKTDEQRKLEAAAKKQEATRLAQERYYERYQAETKQIRKETKEQWEAVSKRKANMLGNAINYLNRNPDLPRYLFEQYKELTLQRIARSNAEYESVNALQQARIDYAYIKYIREEIKLWADLTPTQRANVNQNVKRINTAYEASSEKLRVSRQKLNEANETCNNSSSSYNQSMDSWNETQRIISSARARSGSTGASSSYDIGSDLRETLRRLNNRPH